MLRVSPFLKKEYVGFWRYILERQKIWYKRFILKELPPWTSDPVLQRYHFCNNYRELDKGTIYLINKLTPQKANRKSVLFNVVAYRFFNSYGFFDKIGGLLDPVTYDPYVFIKTLDELIAKGERLYSPAYVISPLIIKPTYRAKDKHVQLAFILEILQAKINELMTKIDSTNTPKEGFESLKEIPNVGNFLAYEFWTDLTYFDFFKQTWTDNDFANIGPGARWGLNIMMGKDIRGYLLSQKGYLKLLNILRDRMPNVLRQLGLLEEWLEITYKEAHSNVPFLSLRNIEHSLCEYRKYWRIKNNKSGRRRLLKSEQSIESGSHSICTLDKFIKNQERG